MTHPWIDQLRFARREFERGLGEVVDPQAQQRFGNLNCISWIVGHLAWQEQRYWLHRAQGRLLYPELNRLLAYGRPASTPPAPEMWVIWRAVTQAADPWLDALDTPALLEPLGGAFSNIGTFVQRVTYHYWYHLGEGMAVRQLLGHTGLPDFVGDIDNQAPYQPETGEPLRRMDKATLIARVEKLYARWLAVLAQVGEARLTDAGPGDGWSIKDLIAHLTWYEREVLGVLQKRALVASPWWDLPPDERNARIHAASRDLPLAQVQAEAAEIHRELLSKLEWLAEEDLHDPARFPGMPADWRPWELFAENTYYHYLDHIQAVQAQLASS